MAQSISLVGGSPLIGSPITYAVKANVIDATSGTVAFHRVKLTVMSSLSDGSNSNSLTLSSPAESGETINFDVSSALRACADSYAYSVNPPSAYPSLSFSLSACDEYMQNGEVHEDVGVCTTEGFTCYMGAFSDMERMLAGGSKQISGMRFTRKPTTMAEVVMVGETVVMPTVSTPGCKVYDITTEGVQTLDEHPFYAVPAGQLDRYEFRFVNGLGCLESISVRSYRTSSMNVTQDSYIRDIQETFSTFSRGLVRKKNDYETWKLSSGPLDEAWESWFLHEFIMAKYVWCKVSGHWLPCHIIPDDTVVACDRTQAIIREVLFSVQFDLNGSLLTALAK